MPEGQDVLRTRGVRQLRADAGHRLAHGSHAALALEEEERDRASFTGRGSRLGDGLDVGLGVPGSGSL